MKFLSALLFGILVFSSLQAQQTGQTVRGTVIDKITKNPLVGATVYIQDTEPIIGASTDANGKFVLKNVPIRRNILACRYVGYSTYYSDGFIVTSAKEVVVEVEMTEGISIDGVTVSAVRNISEPLNELAYVSARSFSVEESERIPTSLNDVSRMAQAFPGTQQGRLDVENDIIVRGNTSFGMIWRLEGIDIPSPNHYARPGSAGGGISILSAQLMDRSDFYTGGMPAEFGNSISSAFDIRLKNGNLNKVENRAKVSLIGVDYALEGPIKKDRSSFIFNYRYSMLGILNRMGFHPAGENAFNEFTDFSFNLYFSKPEKNTSLNIFGMGGLSTEIYNPLYPLEDRDPNTLWHWEYVSFKSNMGTVGAVYTKIHDTKSFSKLAMAVTASGINRFNDTLDFLDRAWRYRDDFTKDSRLIGSYVYSNRLDSAFRIKTGVSGNVIVYDFFQINLGRRSTLDISKIPLGGTEVEGMGIAGTVQAFAQATYNFNQRFSISGGLNMNVLLLNNTASIDPRLAAKFQINETNRISLAVGKYSQHLPLPAYLYKSADTLSTGTVTTESVNRNLKMIYSNHFILSYQFATLKQLKVQTELYLQDLHHVPVAADPNKFEYTMLNDNSEFPVLPVSDKGRGLNYGIDFVVEKLFSNNFYFMATGSLFASKYKPLNNQWYHTRFSSNWVSALTAGREFNFGKGRTLQVGARFIHNGGHRYSEPDEQKSVAEEKYVASADGFHALRMPAYWKLDGRLAYRFSTQKTAMNISLDMSNLTGHKNPNSVGYDSKLNELFFYYHSGNDFIPLLSIQVDF